MIAGPLPVRPEERGEASLQSFRTKIGAAVSAILAAATITVSVASAQPVPPPPGWAGPHYYWHGRYWHHRGWAYRNHHRYYRYY